MKLASVFHNLGWTLLILAAGMSLPAFLALFSGGLAIAWDFFFAAMITGFIGGAVTMSTGGSWRDFHKRECFLFVALVWFVLAFFATIPLYLAVPEYGFAALWFEAVSGLTSTGASIFPDLGELDRAVIFWRAILQWGGGFLILVIVFVIMNFLGAGGLSVFQSIFQTGEGEKLSLRTAQTAGRIFPAYLIITAVCALLLWAAGAPVFEAVCLAFSTISTGGFMPRNEGVASYDSSGVSLVLAFFMLVGATNFSLHWALLQGRWRPYWRNRELRLMLPVLGGFIALGYFWLIFSGEFSLLDHLSETMFLVISLITTTGFWVSEGGLSWGFPAVLTISLVLIGGSTGSTAGGIKLMRFSILLMQARRELVRLSYPNAMVSLRYGRRPVQDMTIWSVWAFFFSFLIVVAAITLALTLTGIEPFTALAASISSLTNTGPALMMMDPEGVGYGDFSTLGKLFLALAMILGRLELLIFVVILMPVYWRG